VTRVEAEDVRAHAERAARELLQVLAALPARVAVRVAESDGRRLCQIRVGEAGRAGGREACKHDVVTAICGANRPLTRARVVRALRDAGRPHAAGAIARALAELTATGELVNPRDKRGYRLPGWHRVHPNLFSGPVESR
jgi:hypothetical protein